MLEVDTRLSCNLHTDCDQKAYLIPQNSTNAFNFEILSGKLTKGIDICCATFPHFGPNNKIVKDKFCYPRTVLNMEMDPRYIVPGEVNPYPLAWCGAFNSIALATAFSVSIALSLLVY